MWKASTMDHSPPSQQAGWNSQRLFSLADGKHSSVEPQYLTDKITIFLSSLSGSQVNRGFAGITKDALTPTPGPD